MAYVSGRARSADELVEAILNFGTKTVGRFSDPFKGSRGRSTFEVTPGIPQYTTFALQHNDTGAVYLFDIVEGTFMNNTASQHVLVGQLFSEFVGEKTIQLTNFYDANLDVPLSNCTWTLSVSNDVYTFVASMGASSPSGAISAAIVGNALVTKDSSNPTQVRHIFEIKTTSVAEQSPPYTQTLTATYAGTFNVVTGTGSTSSPPAGTSGTDADFFLSSFPAYDNKLLIESKFGSYASNMWDQEITAAEIADGWFPRMGRLNFGTTAGMPYDFFGGPNVGDEYFHMRINGQHWWMGRTSAVGGPVTYQESNAGMFLATSGPHTDEHGKDTYQYAMSYQNASEVWKNPSVMLTPFVDAASSTIAIPLENGGRYGYGPNGANHYNTYGPTSQYQKSLLSTLYSIQNGLNGFEGGASSPMDGGRGRTIYPLRPASPLGNNTLEISESYMYPFVSVDAICYSLPMPEEYSALLPTSGKAWNREDFSAWSTANSSISTTTGYAVWTATTLDPYISSPAFTAVPNPASVDVVEMRFRLSQDPGTAAPWAGELRWREEANSPAWDALMTISEPDGVRDGYWVTATWPVGSDTANWTSSSVIERIRFDLFNGTGAENCVVEIDYVTMLTTRDHQDSYYGAIATNAYYFYLGQVPGVFRGTSQGTSTVLGVNGRRSVVKIGRDTYDLSPVWFASTQTGDRERPPRLISNSGKASYVYKR